MLSSIVSALAFALEPTFAFRFALVDTFVSVCDTQAVLMEHLESLNIERPSGPRSNTLSINEVSKVPLASVLPTVAVQCPALTSSHKAAPRRWSCMNR